jgi:hypothetical protein
MTSEEMIEKFTKSINAVSYDGCERTTSFCNSVSRHANDNYNLNAAYTTQEGNAFIAALDKYFG